MVPETDIPKRPLIRYHGGKWRLAPWIISLFPAHRRYVEPFGGGASILLRKPRVYSEVYNDLDDEITNLFQITRDRGQDLARLLELTPYPRREYRLSFELSNDTMEQARRTVVRSSMGFGSNSLMRAVKSGFRANSDRSGTTPARDWWNYPPSLLLIQKRLQGCVIENQDAKLVMSRHDSEDTLHYVDPPYVHSTRTPGAGRGARRAYHHELTDVEHVELIEYLRTLKGRVVLSGYHCDLYDELLADWSFVERPTFADGARKRTEVIWIKP